MNEGFGKDCYRKGNSVKRFDPFTETPDSENCKVAVLIPFPKISSYPGKSPGTSGEVWEIAGKEVQGLQEPTAQIRKCGPKEHNIRVRDLLKAA